MFYRSDTHNTCLTAVELGGSSLSLGIGARAIINEIPLPLKIMPIDIYHLDIFNGTLLLFVSTKLVEEIILEVPPDSTV